MSAGRGIRLGLVVTAVLVVGVVVSLVGLARSSPLPDARPVVESVPVWDPPVAATGVAAGVAASSAPGAPRPAAAWVDSVAARTGIPARVVTAYGSAQLTLHAEDPGCHLGWTTLAGIGAIESDHGRHGGASVGADGVARPTILGPPLDGTAGNRAIADTDGGVLDGDTRWDRAVGPMQFIPTTWVTWGRSASGGVPDPSNVDDAALTAAVYLCVAGQDMATPAGWTAAIATYNAPFSYAVSVSDVADGYAARSVA
ncbi:murein transglycosylase [Jatrophihabitans sp. YIM 134969]